MDCGSLYDADLNKEDSKNTTFNTMEDQQSSDICRVCRSEGQAERPLFHPCICTGSIKWIHQECLTQWMHYSRKEYCELCSHHFSFTPIYSPNMPRRLPLKDVVSGLLHSVGSAVVSWLHYTLVAIAWLGVVPLAVCRIYRCFFTVSVDSVLTLPMDILSMDNIASDVFHGCFVVTCTLFSFIGLVWLREQILHGGGPEWLERDNAANAGPAPQPQAAAAPPPAEAAAPVPAPAPAPSPSPAAAPAAEEAAAEAQAAAAAPAPEEAAAEAQAAAAAPAPAGPNAAMVAGPAAGGFVVRAEGMQLPEQPEEDSSDETSDENSNDTSDGDAAFEMPLDHPLPQPPAVEADRLAAAAPAPAPAPGPPPQADGAAAAAAADEINWNPMDWERGPEEITWERLLGLDGSLAFLEHVFWVVSLNALFILMFAFIPYHIGHIALGALGLREHASAAHFEGLVMTLFGYCIIGLSLVLLHALVSLCGMPRTQRILGFCYVVVKVSLLSVVEVTVLPLICGWWLDICSLAVFDATLKDREASFRLAPGTSLFIHWMVGMVYVYYFTSFVLLLREVLRPGVLWFIRNLNEPDFNPIQEMIHLPFLLHIRRLLVSTVTLGTVVMLVLWLPIRILRAVWPSFLPYTVAVHSDTHTQELSLELLLLQVILPALLEQAHTRTWMKGLVGAWCRVIAIVLDLHSYLLGDDPPKPAEGNNQNENQPPPAGGPAWPAGELGLGGGGLGVIHQALIQQESPVGFRPYVRPPLFGLRLVGLFLAMCVSLVIASLIVLTVPVWLGRQVMSMWLGANTTAQMASALPTRNSTGRIHELYTAACGIYLCWLGARAVSLLLSWLPQGRAAMMNRVRQWCIWGVKAVVAFSVLLGLIPLLFGLLLELVVVVPLRVSLDQSAVLFVWQDWALGVLYTKIACALTMLGPDWFLRRAIERAYHEGIRTMDLRFILQDLAAPVIFCFGLALAVPYATAHGIVPVFVTSLHLRNLIARRIYPFLLLVVIVAGIVSFQVRQFRKLYNHIKDSKYLVGRQLVNYDHRRHKANAARAQ